MPKVVPWPAVIALIEPHYPRSGRVGRPAIGVPRMYFPQQWYGLSDKGLEDAIHGSPLSAADRRRSGRTWRAVERMQSSPRQVS